MTGLEPQGLGKGAEQVHICLVRKEELSECPPISFIYNKYPDKFVSIIFHVSCFVFHVSKNMFDPICLTLSEKYVSSNIFFVTAFMKHIFREKQDCEK